MGHRPIFRTVVVVSLLAITVAIHAGDSGTAQLMYPAGSGADRAFGDWVSRNGGGGLNTHYSFFVEVPPNQTQLTIEVFDADILAGGAGEEAAGRDRPRTAATTVEYTVLRPDGTAVPTNFTTGSTTTPTGGDNAWATLLSYSVGFVRDQFGTTTYANNDGSVNWNGPWTEVDDGNATGGYVQVNSNVTTNALQISGPGTSLRSATRIANVASLGANPTLTFNYYYRNLETADLVELVMSTNNFVTTCSTTSFTNLSGNGGPTAFTLALPAGCISSTTSVRFRTSNLDGDGGSTRNDFFYVDNVQIKGDPGVPNGHWEVWVDQSSAVTSGNALNGFAIRAHDGNAGAGGTEYNVYAENMVAVGSHPNQTTDYTLYPWMTSGCQCGINDFDTDSDSTTAAQMVVTSRTGAFTQTFADATLSIDDDWNRDLTSTFTTADTATGYGIWSWAVRIPYYVVGGTPNGNYATVYLSSDQAAANPPTANPVPNSFRTYFPTDTGSAPVKPYLEQLLTFKNTGTASNPPTAGQTARYQVTVRLVNPTASAITFSSPTNIVTANVPGGAVTYVAASAQVSQGTLLGQPLSGGSGNITWNPGTVAAGSTQLLSYTVQVAYAGGTVNMTGTPASNGTRAQYLDETANAAQTRATSRLGPLCQLSIGTLATDAVVASLDASKDRGRVTVLWTTTSELGAASFDLLRQEKSGWVKVNGVSIPALYTNGAGGTYSVDDPGANGGRQTWAVRETTIDGRTILHGPFAVTPRPPQAADPKADGAFGSKPNETTPSKPKPELTPKATATSLVAETADRGIYSIPAARISSILGMPEGAVFSKIRGGGFRLTRGSADVAWTPSPGGDAILFFAEALDSPYGTHNAYQLTEGQGTVMPTAPFAATASGATAYSETKWFETDAFAATAVPLDAESDYWFQESFVPGYPGFTTKSVQVDVDSLASSGAAAISVKLQGATAARHGATIRLNGVDITSRSWDGITPQTITGAIPASLLREGSNTVTIEGASNGSDPLSVFYLDSIGITYQRTTTPRNGQLEFEGTGPTTVAGLSALPLILDASNPMQPVQLAGVMPDPAGNVSWSATPGRRYALAVPDGIKPASTRASRAADLSAIRAADMLIVTSAALHDAAEAYAQFRRSTGLRVEIADVEAIYDAMSGGLETPHAIRAYLRQASQWAIRPSYVLLAGRGSFDYKGIAGELPIVPPLMLRSADGIFASDARVADVDGDGAPDFAIGRIPVSDEGELRDYLAKVERLESSQTRQPALFAAGSPDRGVAFGVASDGLQGVIPFGASLRINLQDTPLASARAQLMSSWASGLSIVNWTGHGGIDRLASEGLLLSSDAGSLTSEWPPVLVALSCVINRFELPNYPTLGEQLVLNPTGGAVATWAPTGLAYHGSSASLGDAFYRELARDDGSRLGDLIRAAAARNPGAASELFVLLGDPALEVRMPLPASGTHSGE